MLARAKLNLALHVTGQRADGYHLLDTLVAFAELGDEIAVGPSGRDTLTVDGSFASQVPPLEENSLGKALALVRGWGLAQQPVHIALTKNLPVASGIGGGSADAAALIALLTEGAPLGQEQLAQCLTLGADVPMCLAGKSALVGGIGEENQPVTLPPAYLVLANPGVAVATPDVFRALTDKTNPPLPEWTSPPDFQALIDCLRATRNDLMAPAIALAPQIANCLESLAGAPFTRMSGSGATCFALVETGQEADALAAKVRQDHPGWWVQAGRMAP
jgi:4-diphosphocytidyl-2-C-methyl-D-erythritol kinase